MSKAKKGGWRGWVLVTAGFLVVVGGIIGLKAGQIASLLGFVGKMQAAGMPPVPVATVLAEKQSWEETLEFPGTLRPVQGVTLKAEIPGVIKNIPVENGAAVKKGDLLVEYDVASELAELAAAEARLRLAKVNLDRAQDLLARRTVAQSEFDSAKSSYDEALSSVTNLNAILARKMIRAPFDGMVGIREVNPGQRVAAGDALMPLQNNNPIYVEFDVPQTRLAALRLGLPLRVDTDGLKEPAEGKITAINPVVDELTRTARVQGTLSNPDGLLRPGQFVRVTVVLPERTEAVVIPVSALLNEAYGASVFVVEDRDGKLVARQRFVKPGKQRGDFIAIFKGIEPGERIVSAGAFKLTNDASVVPNDAMQPAASLDPKPDNS